MNSNEYEDYIEFLKRQKNGLTKKELDQLLLSGQSSLERLRDSLLFCGKGEGFKKAIETIEDMLKMSDTVFEFINGLED